MSFTSETEVKEALVGHIHSLKVISGYSAYELALKCGFKGTLEEWLKSLEGTKGEPGSMELSGELDAKNKRIMNIADPEDDGDAVNRKYFENRTKAISLYGTDTDIDQLFEPGNYYGRNVTNSPFTDLYLEVGHGALEYMGGPGDNELCTKDYYYQKAIDLENGTMAFRRIQRRPGYFTNVEWEYENPPLYWHSQLLSPIVYKTTERFNSKPVYTAMIYIDSFEDGKNIDISSSLGESGVYRATVLRYSGYLYDPDANYRKTLPYFFSLNETDVDSAWLTFYNKPIEAGSFRMWMQMHGHNAAFDAAGYHQPTSGLVQIWYVKE